jgi:hypothetical protein
LTVVVALTEIVSPLEMYFAVPDPGTGVLPSVVYQIPVFASRPVPGSVNVIVCEPVNVPLAGEIVGATLVWAPVGEVLNVFPVQLGR